ncbi:hypothetical protein MVEN_01377000 [Mycena venus]|uniref:F-box domain-containing protein n=1 Tax=Mycena venus TaxID=2733690 RepID=A0A8H7CSE6_9AGAR|nr:hypothetical protein MVEN_01377000 [Mycena venus]
MESESTSWSRIPPEIVHEIAAQNADDVASLCAWALVSKAMRSLAIEHLFSSIHFACAEDFSEWQEMIHRTPRLSSIVKKVKFSDPDEDWLELHRKVQYPTKLSEAGRPEIPTMPNVRTVEWEGEDVSDGPLINVGMAVAHIALFPNMKELHLKNITFLYLAELTGLLGACGKITVLTLSDVVVHLVDGDSEHSTEWVAFDPTALEELAITHCNEYEDHDYLESFVQLIQTSAPARLRSLTFVGDTVNERNGPCSVPVMEQLLRLASTSLVNLTVDPRFLEDSENEELIEMFGILPAFPALTMLSISLCCDNSQAEQILNALAAAPNLTTIIFRIMLINESEVQDHIDFKGILATGFPSHQSMQNFLTQKFPMIQRIGCYIYAGRESELHWRRGLRRRMERRLREHVGADVESYLELKWLDPDHTPVAYSKATGKAPWKFPSWRAEPDTETSDCEAEKWESELS